MATVREHFEHIAHAVSALDGIEAHTHRFGGLEFNLGKIEIGHIHSNGMVDIPFTRKIREGLVAAGDAEPHHLLNDSGWITFYVQNDQDVAHAIKLFRLSYLHKKYRKPADRGAEYRAEIDKLEFSRTITEGLHGSHE
jgi:hypothetical protein